MFVIQHGCVKMTSYSHNYNGVSPGKCTHASAQNIEINPHVFLYVRFLDCVGQE